MDYDVAGFTLAFAAAARSFAPDVWFLVRRLLGAGVRLGAQALVEQQPPSPAAQPDAASLDEGGRR
ncbi:hypothetical protein ACFRIC_17470 [Streptomyces sp. NPDC056738]|uniref:hypothetical protein n=1 Tax=Streptomyces sp. NPDC056738 TaxID=3345933 RepID=UPI0036A1CA3F